MDFETVRLTATLLSKPFAHDFMAIIAAYQSVSAAQVASRLGLHIKTAQDFLEQWHQLGYLQRQLVQEGKRPFYRYQLQKNQIEIRFDWQTIAATDTDEALLDCPLRERKNVDVQFTVAGNKQSIAAITIFSGNGRARTEQRWNLTAAQGQFVFHLPFPTAPMLNSRAILTAGGIGKEYYGEILDLVRQLKHFKVIELQEA